MQEMKWVSKGCKYCGGDLYVGTDDMPGYKKKPIGKCLQCSRITPISMAAIRRHGQSNPSKKVSLKDLTNF